MAINGARSVQKTAERYGWDDIVCKYDRVKPRNMPYAKRISAHKVRRFLARDLRREIADADWSE